MNQRLAAYELMGALKLTRPQSLALEDVAGLGEAQESVSQQLPRVIALLGAALVGIGVILWLAANWPDLGRMTKFVLLESLIVLGAAGALWKVPARQALLLVTLLAQGGVLAFFGQTYQTGADAWQLFALWAALGLLFALASRHDALWLPWVLVAMLAISLWTAAMVGHSWLLRDEVNGFYYASWAMDAALIFLLAPLPAVRRLTGAGTWSYRAAVLLTVGHVSFAALNALFSSQVGSHYGIGVLVLGAAAGLFASAVFFDVFALSVVVLAIDVLLIAGAGRYLLDTRHGEVGTFLVLGLFSAAIVAASASGVRALIRRHETTDSEGVAP